MSPTDVSAIDDVRIDRINDLVAPNEIISRYPVSDTTTALIKSTRAEIAAIMRGDDARFSWSSVLVQFTIMRQPSNTRRD